MRLERCYKRIQVTRPHQQCEVFCQQNGIELFSLKVDLENRTGYGLEAEARHLRYDPR